MNYTSPKQTLENKHGVFFQKYIFDVNPSGVAIRCELCSGNKVLRDYPFASMADENDLRRLYDDLRSYFLKKDMKTVGNIIHHNFKGGII